MMEARKAKAIFNTTRSLSLTSMNICQDAVKLSMGLHVDKPKFFANLETLITLTRQLEDLLK